MEIIRGLVLAFLFGSIGCASAPVPEQHLYLLSAPATPTQYSSDLVIAMGRVTIAPYLRRSQVMLQVGQHEMRPASHHQWAEPLDQSVRRYLRDGLSAELNAAVDTQPDRTHPPDIQVDVMIERFHGDMGGRVILDAQYVIHQRDVTDSPTRNRIHLQAHQGTSGYAELIATKSELLDDLTQRIVQDVRNLQR